MRKLIAVLVIAGLFLGGVACTPGEIVPRLFDSMVVYGAEEQNAIEIEGNIMAVFYQIAGGNVLFWVTDAQIIDRGDGKWDVEGSGISVSGVSQTLVAYGLYKYQEIVREYDDSEYPPVELPIFLDDLGLQEVTADDLPHSEHIGRLTAVDASLAKPATVTRRYLGVNYDVRCFVTQNVVDMWGAHTLDVGDYVLVSFIEENPNGTERNVAIVTDKVYKSW